MSLEEKFFVGVIIILGCVIVCLLFANFSGEEDRDIREGGGQSPARAQPRPARLRKAARFVVKPRRH